MQGQNQEFICSHCGRKVFYDRSIGTKHRNHCPFCLWSRHDDLEVPGDRKSQCRGQMEPIALTFKHEGRDKYNHKKQGELMLVHHCLKCGKISINRLAGDDDNQMVLQMLEKSKTLEPKQIQALTNFGIQILTEEDRQEILRQLFGKRDI